MGIFLPLQSFRGFFAITIVLMHFRINTSIHKSDFIQNASLAVDFFFVLSGFVIAYKYYGKIKSKNDFLFFLKKRFLRLYPLHILTLFIFIIIELLKLYAQINTNFNVTYLAFESHNNFYSLIKNLFLIQGFSGWSFNQPSWSISTEFYTYILFALIIYKFMYPYKILLLLILFFGITILFNNNYSSLATYINLERTIYGFFLGAVTFLFYKKKNKKINYPLPLCLIIISIIYISAAHKLDENISYLIAGLFFSFTIFFTAKLNNNNLLYKLLSNNFFVYLGGISYGIYMIHSPIIWFFRQVARFIFFIPEDNQHALIFGKYIGEIFTLLIIIFIILLSHISLNYFENKFKYKKNK